jgi:hypothetical protein
MAEESSSRGGPRDGLRRTIVDLVTEIRNSSSRSMPYARPAQDGLDHRSTSCVTAERLGRQKSSAPSGQAWMIVGRRRTSAVEHD